ncbi:MAG: hypothetical protein AB7S77_02850 [Desulfatirhabdiaceae bacterium]
MGETDTYRKKLESLLDDWNADFDKLETTLRNAGVDLKYEWDEVITMLRKQRHAANPERD